MLVKVALQPVTLGWLLALLVLILCVVLIVVGQLPLVVGGLIAVLALARLT